jgi:hypothetical protein
LGEIIREPAAGKGQFRIVRRCIRQTQNGLTGKGF